MENQLKVRFKIGEIEFEAEGSSQDVERERESFKGTLLPLAIDAMVRTRSLSANTKYLEDREQYQPELTSDQPNNTKLMENQAASDLNRISLTAFIKQYGPISEQDFVLIAAYYDEKKNHTEIFSSENIKKYYIDARRKECSNISDILQKLVRKGMIMDAPNVEIKKPKHYVLTSDGLKYVEDYVPKEKAVEKKAKRNSKPRTKITSSYSNLNADDLNLKKYPDINFFKVFKDQMMLTLFITYSEGHGEAFSTADVQCLMTDKLGLPATIDQVNGIFQRNKKWFADVEDEINKKSKKHKLLLGAKEYAQSVIDKAQEKNR